MIGGVLAGIQAAAGAGLIKGRTPDDPQFDAQLDEMLRVGALPPGTTLAWLRQENLAIKYRKAWAPDTLENISKIAWGHWYEQRGDLAGVALVRATPAGSFFVGAAGAQATAAATAVTAASASGAAAREAGWSDTADGEDAELGVTYRTWIWLPGYTSSMAPALSAALRAAKSLGKAFHQSVRVVAWELFTPANSPRHPAIDAPRDSYVVRIAWEKHGSGTPVHVLVALIALIVTAVTGWVVIAKVTEKQLKDLGQGIDSLLSNVLSPGLVIAAMVAVFVLARRK